jgi:hypothetical protein
VLSPRQVGALNIDILVARTPKPGMCGGLRKTAVALVVRRDRKGTFVRRFRCISCVRTEVHMFSCLFVHICLHMTYTNVILRNMRITTFLTTQLDETCAHPWSKMVSRITPQTFSCNKKIYELGCAHTKTSQINRQNRFLWGRHSSSEVAVSLSPSNSMALDVRATWMSVF